MLSHTNTQIKPFINLQLHLSHNLHYVALYNISKIAKVYVRYSSGIILLEKLPYHLAKKRLQIEVSKSGFYVLNQIHLP